MNTHTPLAAALALAAVGAPMVAHAQDPATEYKNVTALRQSNRNEDALKLTDRMIKLYGNPSSRVAKQFAHFTPFFYWQKGEILTALGRLDEAYATFDELHNKDSFKDKALINRSKELPGWNTEGYEPLVSAALFQMGNIRYQQAAGKEGQAGDPAKYEECIPLLEEYLKLYETKKVSKKELGWKLDGKVCFLLLQSYLLKPQPDFAKAGEYMEKQRKAKGVLPDDMVFNGLSTVLNIALQNPEYVEWGEKMISANPGSLRLTADRLSAYAPNMFNFGIKANKLWEDALYAGDMKQVAKAARTVYSLFGLVPDMAECEDALNDVLKAVGGASRALPDTGAGVTVDPERTKKLAEICSNLIKDHTELEAYATLTLANNAHKMGSARLAKAGYKVLIDRYPEMNQKKADGQMSSLRDINYLQYAQFCRLTGDEDTAVVYEQKLDPTKVGDGNKNAVLINKMARLVKEKRWEEALPVTQEVINVLSEEKGMNYVSACFSRLAALYMLRRFDQVVSEGEELLKGDVLKPGTLTEEQSRAYRTQASFFVTDACKELGATNPEMLDRSLAHAEEFMQEFPSTDLTENAMAPNVYYDAITVLLRRRGNGNEEAEKADMQKALRYCNAIGKNWPEHELFPTARLMAGNIIISGDDDDVKPEALIAYEEATDAALKREEGKGKPVAVNTLYLLAAYSPEYDREGEDAEAKAARIAGYFDRFWNEADYEGNPYALQMASLQLSRALGANDAAAYDKALKHAQEIIAREANYAFAHNTANPDLEKTINSYVQDYVDGQKKLHQKDLTLEEKTAHLKSFPGIAKEDKYTNAILHMALLNSMTEAMVSAKRGGDNARATELERDIALSFRQMRDQFKPTDLTNFICIQVGNYEVDYARRLPVGSNERKQEVEMALGYFDQVLTRGGDMQMEATLGKANALALSGDESKNKEAYTLYTKLTAGTDPAVVGPALRGLTELNMSMRNYKGAVETADRYVNMRGAGTAAERLSMQMMLGAAFCESGDVEKGLQTYLNVYAQNRGNITFSAPACKAIMQQLWKRNTPTSGDRIKGGFKQSDHWRAWNTGQDYVRQIRAAKIEEKMTPGERDLFNEVVILLDEYSKDAKVQQEEKERLQFQSRIRK